MEQSQNRTSLSLNESQRRKVLDQRGQVILPGVDEHKLKFKGWIEVK